MGTVGTMAARIDNLEKELRRALARNEQLAGVVHALRERVCKLEEFQNDSTYDLSAIQRELGMVFHPKKQSSESLMSRVLLAKTTVLSCMMRIATFLIQASIPPPLP